MSDPATTPAAGGEEPKPDFWAIVALTPGETPQSRTAWYIRKSPDAIARDLLVECSTEDDGDDMRWTKGLPAGVYRITLNPTGGEDWIDLNIKVAEKMWDEAAALSAPSPAAGATGVVPEGWRLVPEEATRDWAYGVAVHRLRRSKRQTPSRREVWQARDLIWDALSAAPEAPTPVTDTDPLVAYLERQWSWSKETFGPALRTKGIVQHITKELREIEADPHDLAEWVDVIILAMDGFWRHGGKPADLLPAMQAKQDRNFARTWPDWRTMGEDQAIEHDRSGEAPTPVTSAPGAEGGEDLEGQVVYLNGRTVTLDGLALEVLRAGELALAQETKAAFARGYSGGLGFALGTCEERGATVAHVQARIAANMESAR